MSHRPVEPRIPSSASRAKPAQRYQLTILLTLAACAVSHPLGPTPNNLASDASIDTLLLRSVASLLADDALGGRRTGTAGARTAAAYLVSECRRLGLEPLSGAGYRQEVPLLAATIVPGRSQIRIVGPGVDTTFAIPADFLADVGNARTLRDFAGELAYVGQAREVLWRRSDLPPLAGRVALMRGELGAYGAAADTLRGRGAVGIIQVVDDARRYRLYRATRGEALLFPADPSAASSFAPVLPAVLAGPRMTVTLYRPLTGVGAGSWNDAYLNGLAAGLPAPKILQGWRAEVRLATSVRRLAEAASNIGCMLRGGTSADRAIAVVAHYDHLGTGPIDARGDSIYNGFADNAVGVAMALGIAQTFAHQRERGRGLKHSLMLLFPVGEEEGLLGSDWFVAHPPWPLSRIAGVVNLDGNAPAGLPVSWRVAAPEHDPLGELARRTIADLGWTATLAPESPGSDYYPFVRRGVPAIFLTPGDGPYEGATTGQSDSLHSALWSRYHQPDDEWSDRFPFAGLARYAGLAATVIRRLDEAEGRAVAADYRRMGNSETGPVGSR